MTKPNHSLFFFSCLIILDLVLWAQIVSPRQNQASFTMLEVGQGDSSLVELPTGGVILTDAGPTRLTTRSLDTLSLPFGKYIDLAVITHPQLDHYGGFIDILDHYNVGAFLMTGRTPDGPSLEWKTLMEKIKDKNIPIVLVGRGDQVKQGDSVIDIISPDPVFKTSGELNDTGIVERVKTGGVTILQTADIGKDVENYLVTHDNIRADILKVAHHGSKYSSTPEFLSAVRPLLATIGVGENHYGHPAPETLDRLQVFVGNNIFRTDQNGTVSILINDGKLQVFAENRN